MIYRPLPLPQAPHSECQVRKNWGRDGLGVRAFLELTQHLPVPTGGNDQTPSFHVTLQVPTPTQASPESESFAETSFEPRSILCGLVGSSLNSSEGEIICSVHPGETPECSFLSLDPSCPSPCNTKGDELMFA